LIILISIFMRRSNKLVIVIKSFAAYQNNLKQTCGAEWLPLFLCEGKLKG